MPTLETSFPVHAKNLKKYLDAYGRDMFDQESMLNLIFVVNELMQDGSFANRREIEFILRAKPGEFEFLVQRGFNLDTSNE